VSSSCKFPDHHTAPGGCPRWLAVAAVAAAAIVVRLVARAVAHAAHVAWHLAAVAVHWGLLALAAVAAAATLAAAVWAARCLVRASWAWPTVKLPGRLRPPAVNQAFTEVTRSWVRHLPAAAWARWRWRWLTRNLGLAYLDRAPRARWLRLPGTTAAVLADGQPAPKLRYPRARIWPTQHGLAASVRTVPGVGRLEVERQAEHLANAWRCTRVQVSQRKSGRLAVRGFKADPLAVPFGPELAPPGTWDGTDPRRLYLGRDEWAEHRHLALPGVTGITVTGQPGTGKTSLVLSWMCQLAPSPAVQPLILDGKAAGDWTDWQGRAMVLGDDPDAAEDALADAHADMLARRDQVLAATGSRNGWHHGPLPAFPLRWVVLDECQTFLDVAARKGDKDAEARARRMVAYTAELIRKGRSVLYVVVLVTQQGTVDAYGGSQVRNNCGLSVAFGLRTRDAAVAALGEQIRDYPTLCPTLHQGPEGVGICTATLRTGMDPFTRLRCPEVGETYAGAAALATAHLGTAAPAVELPERPALHVA